MGGHPGHPAQQVERGALGGQQRPGRPGDRRQHVAARDPGAVVDHAVNRTVPPDACSNTAARPPARRPRRRRGRPGRRVGLVGRDGRDAGHVDAVRAAEVLGERVARRSAVDRAGSSPAVVAGVSSTVDVMHRLPGLGQLAGSRPTPASRCPSQASSASGKSSRQWQPRVSWPAATPPRPARDATVSRFVASQRRRCRRAALVAELGQRRRRWRRATRPTAQHTGAPGHRLLQRLPDRRVAAPSRSASDVDRLGLRRQLGGDVVGDPAGEDEALEQRVRGEPVGAVHARAGDLAARVQARDRRTAAAGPSGRRRWRSARPGATGISSVVGSMPAARHDAVIVGNRFSRSGDVPGVQEDMIGAGRPAAPGGCPWPRRHAAPARPVRAGRP